MSDILLLLGAALCALSVLMAIVSVLRTQPPRAAAITLVLGLALMFSGARMAPEPFGVETLSGAAQRLVDGQISLTPAVEAAPEAEAEAPTALSPAVAPTGEQPSQ